MTNTTVELVFCDMFVYDPNYNIDVRLNTKHQHFTYDIPENKTGQIAIDVKTNLPWFNVSQFVLFKSKCKLNEIYDENTWNDENRNIPYEFTMESEIEVEINKKFFTLYQTASEGMKLPLIYEVNYQIKAFREKLTLE